MAISSTDIVKSLRECVDATNRAAIVTLETDFLCGAALKAADEIEKLRAVLRAIADQNCLTQTHQIAKEALGDE